MSGSVITVLAGLSAVAATVLAFIFLLPEKKRASLNGFFKVVHDILNFKSLLLELILKASYIFATAFTVFAGFFTIFGKTYNYGYYGRSFGDNFVEGILIMILGPIAIRLTYELLMMFVILVKNVTDINKKMGGTQPQQPVQPQQPAQPTNCPNCGNPIGAGQVFCNQCGTKVK